jgi:hypothetical protein
MGPVAARKREVGLNSPASPEIKRMINGSQEVDNMHGVYDDQDMEQRSLPAVLFVLAFYLTAGFVIKEIAIEYFGLKQIWSDCCEWLDWTIIPGWLPH